MDAPTLLGRLIKYLQGYPDWLPNYAQRYKQDRPISTSCAESDVDTLVHFHHFTPHSFVFLVWLTR